MLILSTHPRGLKTLFFTEMWERFSYYGMRALLVLFLTASVATGGMGMDDKTAAAIYGLYTASVYLFTLPGGWIADRLLGLQRAVWYGGIIIAAGHFTMALPWTETFYLGLVLIVLGTGLLKPSISSIVGDLYPEGGARRDAGFSIYYMGINLGAISGPLICGFLGEKVNWHYGFAASGIGMVLGLIQFYCTKDRLQGAGACPQVPPRLARQGWAGVAVGLSLFFGIVLATLLGVVTVDPLMLAANGSVAIVTLGMAYFFSIYWGGGITLLEKKRMWAALVLFIFAALFWAGFEQAGSSFNLFAERYTNRVVMGYDMPASWLQSVNALFVILLAPVFAGLWVRLAIRQMEPSSPVKFALGLAFLGLGFGTMAWAASYVVSGQQVLPSWLVITYLLHTMGELCLSPIGLSLVTKLAPQRFTAQMMGLFFMSSAVGNLFAGMIAGKLGADALNDLPHLFGEMMVYCLGAAALLMLIRKQLSKLMSGIN